MSSYLAFQMKHHACLNQLGGCVHSPREACSRAHDGAGFRLTAPSSLSKSLSKGSRLWLTDRNLARLGGFLAHADLPAPQRRNV